MSRMQCTYEKGCAKGKPTKGSSSLHVIRIQVHLISN